RAHAAARTGHAPRARRRDEHHFPGALHLSEPGAYHRETAGGDPAPAHRLPWVGVAPARHTVVGTCGHSRAGTPPGRLSLPVLRRAETAHYDRHGAGGGAPAVDRR